MQNEAPNGTSGDMAMPNQEKLFNDCVHGHIVLPQVCVSIIDTQIFQRLRNIKQLGFGYFVYPGASHNRFEHSLGVCYLAGELVDALNKNWMASERCSLLPIKPQEKLCIQVAALCHDIGHGPFSHTWEHFIRERMGNDSWKHEDMSLKLFDELCKEEKVVREMDRSGINSVKHREFIKSLILGKPLACACSGDAYFYEIVSNATNGIDVDKWDYLLRDGKQLNINITFDPERLLRFSRIAEYKGQRHICFRDKERSNIYQMYMMRAELHRVAYQHPVVKLIEAMWFDALEKACKSGYRFHGVVLSEIHSDPKAYVKLTDNIFQDILNSPMSNALDTNAPQRLLTNIEERNLYKLLGRIVLNTEPEKHWKRIQERVKSVEHVFVLKIKLEVPLKTLSENVYLYSKKDLNDAQPYEDWSNVPIFPVNKGELERFEIYFYTKSENRKEQEIAEEAAKHIIDEIYSKEIN